jgi:hypothetical protein
LDAFFGRPIFDTSDFVKSTQIPKQTAMPLLRQIKGAGLLKNLREASGRRAAIMVFPDLLEITEGKRIV